jgi:hypothetical protein
VETPPEGDVGAAEAVVGADQPVFDAEPLAELERPRLLREEGVGAALDQETLIAIRLDGAAQPVARLEERQLEPPAALPGELDGAMGGCQTRDAAADDAEPQRGPRATRSASMTMNAG